MGTSQRQCGPVSNQGHAFPRTPLAPAQRLAVVEYLKDPLRFDPAAAEAVR